jgi:hypothetical protein
VLDKHRCPHTGVINFFHKSEPMLAVGSIIESPPGRFVWRSHVDDSRSGSAPASRDAELQLRRAISPSRPRRPSRQG